jgi:hypothetical protein
MKEGVNSKRIASVSCDYRITNKGRFETVKIYTREVSCAGACCHQEQYVLKTLRTRFPNGTQVPFSVFRLNREFRRAEKIVAEYERDKR